MTTMVIFGKRQLLLVEGHAPLLSLRKTAEPDYLKTFVEFHIIFKWFISKYIANKITIVDKVRTTNLSFCSPIQIIVPVCRLKAPYINKPIIKNGK